MKKVSVIGCGYVGLVSGAGIAAGGNKVTCIDIDSKRMEGLKRAEIPFYEPGLKELVEVGLESGRLEFTTDLKKGVENAEVVMLAVQTPQSEDGRADLSYLYTAVGSLACSMPRPVPVVIKSTVPVGTAAYVEKTLNDELSARGVEGHVDVVSNPEFLREGCAVDTFLNPDRIVVGYSGCDGTRAAMEEMYRDFIDRGIPPVFCSNETAEIIKYAANSFLAMKISFINQIALLCDSTGADVTTVAQAVGMDKRINPNFLNPGPGYGGSCFPKDTKAIVKKAGELGVDLSIIREADEANEKHKILLADRIGKSVEEAKGEVIAVWGLAFKAGTGDMRNSPSLAIIGRLYDAGFTIKAYDPKAGESAKTYFKSRGIKIEIADDMYEAALDGDCLVVLTEWPEFTNADMAKVLNKLRKPMLYDLRNIFERKTMEGKGFEYHAVGR